MKAKHIRKLRAQMKWFTVYRTKGLFGDFWDSCFNLQVAARTPQEAAKRFAKRTHRLDEFRGDWSAEKWARIKVVPVATPYTRFITYWS